MRRQRGVMAKPTTFNSGTVPPTVRRPSRFTTSSTRKAFSKHDLVVLSDRLNDREIVSNPGKAKKRWKLVRQTSAELPLKDVLPVWIEALKPEKRNGAFAVAVAEAAPYMITKAGQARAGGIYDLLGQTLASSRGAHRRAAADALLDAVLRSDGEVPPAAREVIRRHRTTLQKYPDVWRHIGAFER